MDCIINTLLFIAGVLPGHIHAFYVTCTYFHRKSKVNKGRYPGGRKAGIYSENVWNGDASNAKVRDLLMRQREEEDLKMMKKASKRSSGLDRMGSQSVSAGHGSRRNRGSVRKSNTGAYTYDGEERRPVEPSRWRI